MMLKPLDKFILLKEKTTISQSGIYMPKSTNPLYDVVKVGKNVIEVKNGDTVIIDNNKIISFNLNQEVFFLIKEEDVIAILEE